MHRESGSVLALTGDDSADADDMPLAGGPVAGEVAIVPRTVRIWHQYTDVLADRLLFAVAELPFRGAAEELHDAVAIDHDHRIRNGLQDRLQMALARPQRFLELFLLVNIEHDAAEMTGHAVLVADRAAAGAHPVRASGCSVEPIGEIEITAVFGRPADCLFGPVTIGRLQ